MCFKHLFIEASVTVTVPIILLVQSTLFNEEVKMTMVAINISAQSSQHLVDGYKYINGQNEWWMMRLKAII